MALTNHKLLKYQEVTKVATLSQFDWTHNTAPVASDVSPIVCSCNMATYMKDNTMSILASITCLHSIVVRCCRNVWELDILHYFVGCTCM